MSTSYKHLSPTGAAGVILRTIQGRLDIGQDHWVLARCSGHRRTTGSREPPAMGLPLQARGALLAESQHTL